MSEEQQIEAQEESTMDHEEIDNNFEEKASEMGWVPKEKWRGDPSQWRPAEEFVKRGESIIPILNDRVHKLESDLKMALKVNERELKEIKAQSYERARAEYDAKLQELREKEDRAFMEGDQEEFDKVRQQREKIKPPEPVVIDSEPEVAPEFEPWVKKNPWYQNDDELREYADSVGEGIVKAKAAKGESISNDELFSLVEKTVKATYASKFENPRRSEPGAVEGGTDAPKSSDNRKTFADLPASAKQQYERMAKKFEMQGRKFTKEQYATTYFEG